MEPTRQRKLISSSAAPAGLLALALAILALVAASPIALRQVAKIPGMNWVLLSNVGQTYGAISAVLSALALGGVILSILYQARDVRNATEQSARSFQFELLKMEMGDPFYMEIMAPTAVGVGQDNFDSLRRRHFIHMWVSYWEGQYKVREMSDNEVRNLASNVLFRSSEGRRYWSGARETKLSIYRGRLSNFVQIMDEEYKKIIPGDIPRDADTKDNGGKPVSEKIKKKEFDLRAAGLFLAGAGTALAASRVISRQFLR